MILMSYIKHSKLLYNLVSCKCKRYHISVHMVIYDTMFVFIYNNYINSVISYDLLTMSVILFQVLYILLLIILNMNNLLTKTRS